MKTKNKQLLIQLIINRFIKNKIVNYTGGQTQITLTDAKVIINIYDTGSVNIQGKKNEEIEAIIKDFVNLTNIQE